MAHAHGAGDLARAALLLAVTWWMFGGYAWLTNNLGTDSLAVRLLLIGTMAAFLVMALCIPQVAGRDGVPFGLAYLAVTLMHAWLFTCAPNASARAIYRVAPFNVLGASLLIAAGFTSGAWNLALWAASLAALLMTGLLGSERAFELNPGHFAERHGLIVIIALGESVVGLGVGAAERAVTPALALEVALGIGLLGALWWSYFARDDVRAERVLTAANGAERARLAFQVYWFAHLMMIAGIVAAAAGLQGVVSRHETPATPWFLGSGLFLYLLGETAFRRWLCLGPVRMRLAAAALALAAIGVGIAAGGVAQIAATFLALVGMLAMERVVVTAPRAASST